MGGGKGGSDKASREMINLQKQEAAEARAKEGLRQERINKGLGNIKAMFRGGQTTDKRASAYDWSTFKPTAAGGAVSGLPAGFTYASAGGEPVGGQQATRGGYVDGSGGQRVSGTVQWVKEGAGRDSSPVPYINGQRVQQHQGPGRDSSPYYTAVGPTAMTPVQWGIRGPGGEYYKPGQNISTTQDVVTGTHAGFGDTFYNKFKQAMLDYYNPQVAEQYGDAQKETLYRLARAGTSRSTMANEALADIEKQNKLAGGNVISEADKATGALRTRVANEEQNAINQLYSTENPEVASNTALASIRDISAETPDLTPLGEVFKIATLGSANALKGYMGEKYRQRAADLNKGATSVVT